MKQGHYTIVKGFITQLMPKKDKSYLVIDNFNRIDTDISKRILMC